MIPIRLLVHCKKGTTALEYGLIAAVIVASGLYGFTILAGALSTSFVAWGNSL